MRYPKQQFFLLIALSLGITVSPTSAAFSRDFTVGLSAAQSSSQLKLETVELTRVRGSELLSQSSGILELEPGSRSHRDRDADASENSQDAESHGASRNGEPETPGEDNGRSAPAELAQPANPQRFQQQEDQRQYQQDEVQQPIRQIEEAPTRIERRTEEAQTYQSNQSSDALNSGNDAAAKAKSKKTKLAKKRKGRDAKLTADERIETAPPRAVTQPPVQPPSATQPKPAGEEALLAKLVRELEFGTLQNSISYLNQLVAKCPSDPDYKSLLTMALRLRDGDVWYQYQRKVDYKEPEVVKIPTTIMKPTPNDTVNELKKSSWFLIRSVKR